MKISRQAKDAWKATGIVALILLGIGSLIGTGAIAYEAGGEIGAIIWGVIIFLTLVWFSFYYE